MFKTTEWEYSGVKEERPVYKDPLDGERYLFIEDASYDDDSTRYTLNVSDLGDRTVRYRLTYNLSRVDKVTGDLVPNISARNALVGLGKALFGRDVGVPFPGDVIGGVVRAQVKLREYNGRNYANVYEYGTVSEDMAVFAEIDQYYDGYDAGEWEEGAGDGE